LFSQVLLDVNTYPNSVYGITGKLYQLINKESGFENVLARIKVFARISPDYKGYIISDLQKLKLSVAMVGDGANDTQALKQVTLICFNPRRIWDFPCPPKKPP